MFDTYQRFFLGTWLYSQAIGYEMKKKVAVQVPNAVCCHQEEDFLNAIVHELRAPITVLTAFAQLHAQKQKKHVVDTISSRELTYVFRELKRLTRLVDDILSTTHFEMGKLSMNRQPLRLDTLIEDLIAELQPTTGTHQFDVHTTPAVCSVDEQRLTQVLTNLVVNALKYAPPQTTIAIVLTCQAGVATVEVRDEGPGISQEDQDLIFRKYYRATTDHTTKTQSFGLGLYIAQAIMELHGGKLWVESKLGSGSSFFFSLPLAAL